MLIRDSFNDIIKTIQRGKLLLLLPDSGRIVFGSLKSLLENEHYENHFNHNQLTHLKIIFGNIAKLKNVYPHIHPRVETLLALHKKQIFLKTDAIQLNLDLLNNDHIHTYLGVAITSLQKQLINKLNSPIVIAHTSDSLQDHFDWIPHDLYSDIYQENSVNISNDNNGNLIFLDDH